MLEMSSQEINDQIKADNSGVQTSKECHRDRRRCFKDEIIDLGQGGIQDAMVNMPEIKHEDELSLQFY